MACTTVWCPFSAKFEELSTYLIRSWKERSSRDFWIVFARKRLGKCRMACHLVSQYNNNQVVIYVPCGDCFDVQSKNILNILYSNKVAQ